jgi:hypothetical protein
MAVRLNKSAFDHARHLIAEGKFIADKRDDRSDHQPSAADENEFIRLRGYTEFGSGILGSMTRSLHRPRDTMNSHTGIS